jgi:hypothetical protein
MRHGWRIITKHIGQRKLAHNGRLPATLPEPKKRARD